MGEIDLSKRPSISESAAQRVLLDSQLYTNYASLPSEEQQIIQSAIFKLVSVLHDLSPTFSEEQLFKASADALFTILNFKSEVIDKKPLPLHPQN